MANNNDLFAFADFAPAPTPSRLWETIVTGDMLDRSAPSLMRVGLGLLYAMVIGVAAGILIGRMKWVNEMAAMPFQFPRIISPLAWVVLVSAEYLGVTSGLGCAIIDARNTLDYPSLGATVTIVGVVDSTLDYLCMLAIQKLTCKIVAKGRFSHANSIHDLEPCIMDDPPALLGDEIARKIDETASMGTHHARLRQGGRLYHRNQLPPWRG